YAHPEAADQPFAPTGQGRLQQRLTARRKCVFHFQGDFVIFPSLVLSNFTSSNIACYAGYLTKSSKVVHSCKRCVDRWTARSSGNSKWFAMGRTIVQSHVSEDPAAGIKEGRLKPPFAGNSRLPLPGQGG